MLSFTNVTVCFFFFFNDTATTEIYTLSLHDALPISLNRTAVEGRLCGPRVGAPEPGASSTASGRGRDRKSTRLNSSHSQISYAVFCLKKKKKGIPSRPTTVSSHGANTVRVRVLYYMF